MGMNTHQSLVEVAAHVGIDCSDRHHGRCTLTRLSGSESVIVRPNSLVVGLNSQYKLNDEWLSTHRVLVGLVEVGDVV